MNVLIVTPSYKPAFVYGGPIVSVGELAEALVQIGHRVTVYTTTANGASELDVATSLPVNINGVAVRYFSRLTGDPSHVSPALWWFFLRTHKQFDRVHIQSWWNMLVMITALICKLSGKTFIISPRGMLGAYSFTHRNGSIKKWLHMLLGRHLLKGSILHATSQLEWRDCSAVQQSWKGFILHTLVKLPSLLPRVIRKNEAVITLGFLSRIDQKKGLEMLFQTLSKVSFSFQLKIAGTGEPGYIQNLKDLVCDLGIEKHVEWCGWMSGEEKYRFLEALDFFVLPSYNENFAVVVAEALAIGTPVIVSSHVGLADYVQEKDLGWVFPLTLVDLNLTLTAAVLATEKRVAIREKAPAIIARDFDRLALARQYVEAYKSF